MSQRMSTHKVIDMKGTAPVDPAAGLPAAKAPSGPGPAPKRRRPGGSGPDRESSP
jgi:hypothetical protein